MKYKLNEAEVELLKLALKWYSKECKEHMLAIEDRTDEELDESDKIRYQRDRLVYESLFEICQNIDALMLKLNVR